MPSPSIQLSPAPVDVESVINTFELPARAARPPDLEAENLALLELVITMAESPEQVLQKLVDRARELCDAGSAGISLLDPEFSGTDARFRWMATSGEYGPLVGNTLPRHFSPCGTVLDQDRMLLMRDPIRFFPYIQALLQPVREVLLVPFYRGSEAIGTVWIVAHDDDRRFDREDARVVTNLSRFAAAAVQVLATAQANRRLESSARQAAESDAARLAHENMRIATLMVERQSAEATVRRELKDAQLLRDVAGRLIGSADPVVLFEDILDAAMAITDADAGTIQLLDASQQTLSLLASRGFDIAMRTHFAQVDSASGSSCGIALARGERIFLRFDDLEAPDPDGALGLHRAHELMCAQSTPLTNRAGQPVGMLSTHWREPRTLGERECRFLDLLGRQAADLIERSQVQSALEAREAELREASRRKDEFLAILAHELRNPLVPIRNGIALLKRAQEHPALIDQIRPMMERQVGHAVRLIDDLLDVTRISSGKIELQREHVALSTVIGSAVEANRDAAAAAGLALQVDLDDPSRILFVDPTRISQVVSNVLHNAVKFTPRGGSIALRTESTAAGDGPPELAVRISDTGDGIAKESLGEIFGLFTQANSENSIRHGGLGIGLALSRSLMELHGGTITADSRGLGEGSEFTIRLPLTTTPVRSAATPAARLKDLSGVRVLVVDDNEDAADSAGLLIEQLGGDVRIAYCAADGLEMVAAFDPALVLLDIGMPEIDGYQACAALRRLKGTGLTIVAVTGWGQDEDRRRATEAGFDAHATKPVDPAQLVAFAAALKT